MALETRIVEEADRPPYKEIKRDAQTIIRKALTPEELADYNERKKARASNVSAMLDEAVGAGGNTPAPAVIVGGRGRGKNRDASVAPVTVD